MNNGKVRIYELSKELNLDNKDILEICTQLNIAVKSHSSTITESNAERIRLAAQKYTPSHVGGRNFSISSTEGGSSNLSMTSPDQSKVQRKQQILAIHKQSPSRANPNGKSSEHSATPPVLATPPRAPIKPQHPSVPTPPQTTLVPEESYLDENKLEQTQVESLNEELSEVQFQPALTPEETLPTPLSFESPQLLSPPVRPTKRDTTEIKIENKPILKPEKKAPSEEAAVLKPEKKAAPQETAKITPPASKIIPPEKEKTPLLEPPGKKPESRQEIKQPSKAPVKLQLQQKPQRPKPAVETKQAPIDIDSEKDIELLEEGELEVDLLLDLTEKPKPKLKRLTSSLPHTAKRGEWEDEEEEEKEDRDKKKAGAKNKRRPQLLLEDEDEEVFESHQSKISISQEAVSISIARPPKPKASTPHSPVATVTQKAKKPTPKNESGSTRLDSKEKRRDRKEVVDNTPEKVALPSSMTVRELSELTHVPETEIIKKLFFKGIAVNITQTVDFETARVVTEELGIKVESVEEKSAAIKATEMIDVEDLENLQRRPPVVTIMGHVDHGKTTLLDSIRKTKVAQGEAGGITQHIGAYHVDVEHEGKKQHIVFLDTPGHEAFTAMRARGARVTDIAVLVVAADDGVQPQTKEAISHAQAAEVPIVVAINKVDKPGSEPDRVKQELTEFGLVPEEWGGETIMVPVSALKGENLDTLLEMLILVAEVQELSANPNRSARGTVIEANLDRSKGPVATLLVQNGTLRVGDTIVAGSVLGKIRAMIDDRGQRVEAATPSFAVEILGLNEVPAAGDEFEVFVNEKEARAIAEERAEAQRQLRLQQALSSRRISLSSLSERAREGELKELNLILKADVQGSAEAILGALQQLPQNEVQIRILMAAPGEVTETDVDLAAASGAVIVGFNTTLASGARVAADREGVDIREYNIIYQLLDDIQAAMEGLLEPEEVEEPLGQAEVRVVFPVGRGSVAGCYVLSGKIVRNRLLRVRRRGEIIHEGTIDSLKRLKEDAREVNSGYECGIGCSKFNTWQPGDIIEAYQMVMKRRTLSPK